MDVVQREVLKANAVLFASAPDRKRYLRMFEALMRERRAISHSASRYQNLPSSLEIHSTKQLCGQDGSCGRCGHCGHIGSEVRSHGQTTRRQSTDEKKLQTAQIDFGLWVRMWGTFPHTKPIHCALQHSHHLSGSVACSGG